MTRKRFGLRDKLNLLSIGLVVLTAIGIATFVVHREITTRYQDLVNTGLTTAAMIAQNSEYAVYTENQDAVRRVVGGLQAVPDIAYAAVLGKDRQALLEETWDAKIAIPTGLRTRLPAAANVLFEEVAIQPGHPSYIDILVPVVSRPVSAADPLFLESNAASAVVGYIQLGLSQERLQKKPSPICPDHRVRHRSRVAGWTVHVVDPDAEHHQTYSGIGRSGGTHRGRTTRCRRRRRHP